MTRFYDIDDANAAIPEIDAIVSTLAAQRAELIRIRDDVLARDRRANGGEAGAEEESVAPTGPETAVADERRLTRLRMQGLVDQMAAGVARLEAMGVTLRDIGDGLVDLPALVSGRQVWLCWRRGETEVGHWHPIDSGFAGRRPLIELA
jgi:hypothetical protein